ncbi:putative sulfate permease C3H7.02 [Choanephora cucurbitarum]|uniref:Putative sulfate permease C3H7.02 n=1 Tax=Choanephora cucurbitarum TaxID=101091 RepID=A0A1C7N5M1_9FUNG|nr:putative sulfate permease C3H7.02 [Choanephora cucurbitarum]
MERETAIVVDYPSRPSKYRQRQFYKRLPTLVANYIINIFPIFQWIHKYNTTWLVQDMIAGITVGIVIVPQSMAYAKVANLDPQYGLYSSFVGVTLYCLFGTSKDISVGPISTVSLLISSVVSSLVKSNPNITPSEVAANLGLFAGIISIVISFLRLGILVDFMPEPAIAGYMTGSAITIVLSQWPKLFGIHDLSTHDPPYKVFVHFFQKISHTQIDSAFGLSSLVILYLIRYICSKIKPQSAACQKFVFLFGIMRNGLVVIVATLISFFIWRDKQTKSPYSIIESVPAGFDAMGIPHIRWKVLAQTGNVLPSVVLILILEHISVAKSFGRMSGYQIDPNQEILAIGLVNIVAPFFGGFASTGAFSRTAIMARSGSRTPLAGVFSSIVILLALYVLTPAFYYMPDAVLAAVVIHAVSDLVSRLTYLRELWSSSPIELLVWIGAVVVTLFVDVQTGIYAAVGLSFGVLLYKLARPSVKVMGRVSLKRHPKDILSEAQFLYVDENDINFQGVLTHLPKGLLVFQLSESIVYPNAEYVTDKIVHFVKQKTRCGNPNEINQSESQRHWNQTAPSSQALQISMQLPVLQAVVFDFSAISRLDSSAIQALHIMQDTIDKYAGHPVEWHFAALQNSNVRQSLLHAGFGSLRDQPVQISIPTSSEKISVSSLASLASNNANERKAVPSESLVSSHVVPLDVEKANPDASLLDLSRASNIPRDKYPCFHWDVGLAVQSVSYRLDEQTKRNTSS